ncbi:hypothetical protein GLP40_28660 [Nocardia sp. CT2-14]|uniref:Thiolase C-terminal domain-containing protein n=1 Tax=Nocardia aurantiaca TaxID=2675850 RepID=A0A6I3L7M1_9NOCA|nr:hypothetical protein [Nocardia aurantiaca]
MAWSGGYFAKSVVPVRDFNGAVLLDHDEHRRPGTTIESLAGLKPSFATLGEAGFDAVALQKYSSVERIGHVRQGGNSSGIVDGAALVLVGNEQVGKRFGLTLDGIDLFELNDAFASVVLKFQKDFRIPDEKLNVNGGAIAMGHPLGATGAMLVGTVNDELERRGELRALVTLCVGVGGRIATIIERL